MKIATVITKSQHEHKITRTGKAKKDGGSGVVWSCSCKKAGCYVMRTAIFLKATVPGWTVKYTAAAQRAGKAA